MPTPGSERWPVAAASRRRQRPTKCCSVVFCASSSSRRCGGNLVLDVAVLVGYNESSACNKSTGDLPAVEEMAEEARGRCTANDGRTGALWRNCTTTSYFSANAAALRAPGSTSPRSAIRNHVDAVRKPNRGGLCFDRPEQSLCGPWQVKSLRASCTLALTQGVSHWRQAWLRLPSAGTPQLGLPAFQGAVTQFGAPAEDVPGRSLSGVPASVLRITAAHCHCAALVFCCRAAQCSILWVVRARSSHVQPLPGLGVGQCGSPSPAQADGEPASCLAGAIGPAVCTVLSENTLLHHPAANLECIAHWEPATCAAGAGTWASLHFKQTSCFDCCLAL